MKIIFHKIMHNVDMLKIPKWHFGGILAKLYTEHNRIAI